MNLVHVGRFVFAVHLQTILQLIDLIFIFLDLDDVDLVLLIEQSDPILQFLLLQLDEHSLNGILSTTFKKEFVLLFQLGSEERIIFHQEMGLLI